MSNDVIHAAMATWAAKDLPARLYAAQVAKLLNCSTEDVAILVSAGTLKALGRPRTNGVKLFSTIELFTLLADREWLDDATKAIGQFWRRKNERRKGISSDDGRAPARQSAPRKPRRPVSGSIAPSSAPLQTGSEQAA